MSQQEQLIMRTITGEVFIPVRLSYKTGCRKYLRSVFESLQCMAYVEESKRWCLNLTAEMTFDPYYKEHQKRLSRLQGPLVLGSVYLLEDRMIVDCACYHRALAVIEFFHKKTKTGIKLVSAGMINNVNRYSESTPPLATEELNKYEPVSTGILSPDDSTNDYTIISLPENPENNLSRVNSLFVVASTQARGEESELLSFLIKNLANNPEYGFMAPVKKKRSFLNKIFPWLSQ